MRTYILGTVIALAILISPAIARQVEAASLTGSQINSVIQFLGAFHADQSVIDNVRISLNGGTPILGGQSGINTNPTAPSCVPPMMWNGSVCAVQPSENTASTPTASITMNGGQKSVTVNTGDTITKTWSSTNGTSWNATWAAKAIKGSTCIYNGKIGQHWNGLDGGIDTTGDKANGTESAPATADQVGCIFTITYVVTNNLADKNDVDSIEITFPVNPTIGATGTGNACVAPTTTTTASPLNGVVYGPGATTGIIIEGSRWGGQGLFMAGNYSSVESLIQYIRNWPNVAEFATCISINGDVIYGSRENTPESKKINDPSGLYSGYTGACGSVGSSVFNLISPNYKSTTVSNPDKFTPVISAPLLGQPLDSASVNKLVVEPIHAGVSFDFLLPYGLARSFKFTTGDVGELGDFLFEMSYLGNLHTMFVNISTVPNDFRYDNTDSVGSTSRGYCSHSLYIDPFRYRVANPNDPPILGACRLMPHTTYYLNIRSEDVRKESNSRGKDTADPIPGSGNAFLIQFSKTNPGMSSSGRNYGDWITDLTSTISKDYPIPAPNAGSTTTTSGGTCAAPVASSGSGIDLCKQQGLDNIDETNFSMTNDVMKLSIADNPYSPPMNRVYKMGPGQSYSFPVDSDTIQLPIGAYGNTPAHTVTVSRTVLDKNPYLGSFPHIVNVSQKKCDFNPSSTGCYSYDTHSDTGSNGSIKYLPISASPVNDQSVPTSFGCHLQPGKQYYVNIRWIRKSDIVDASGNIINSSMASGVLGGYSGITSMSMTQINKAIADVFNSKGDTCVNSSNNVFCAIDYYFLKSALRMPKL